MPSLSRRREEDIRAGRLESVIGWNQVEQAKTRLIRRKGLRFCKRCRITLEEDSAHCPRCDRKDEMYWMRQIPEGDREAATQKALRLCRERNGL